MNACIYGHNEVVKLLLNDLKSIKNIDFNAKAIHGRTPLMNSCNNGHNEVVKSLLDHSKHKKPINFDAKAIHGMTLSNFAMLKNETFNGIFKRYVSKV